MTRDDEVKMRTRDLFDGGGTCIVMGCDNSIPAADGSLVCPKCKARLGSGSEGGFDRVVRTMGGRRE